MNLLLDTHVLLWAFADDPRLSAEARELITNGENLVFVSAVSAWEIAIKKALGKLSLPGDFEAHLRYHRYTPLPVTVAHALAVETLPWHHNDPFDRLLVAQAHQERLVLLTADQRLSRYGEWVRLV
ncbi:MAG: twitching motility protein PilT [Meiothermus sp.]|nr:MAG: twitching motility protein PilT [Meiothermus sp.]